jgi:hypothetical protein
MDTGIKWMGRGLYRGIYNRNRRLGNEAKCICEVRISVFCAINDSKVPTGDIFATGLGA